jgi:hydroxymethylglutaryl-CoA synthase
LAQANQDNNIDHYRQKSLGVFISGQKNGIDGSKPIKLILIALMEQKFGKLFIRMRRSRFTACIGGVDAMQNCIDYVTLNQTKKPLL